MLSHLFYLLCLRATSAAEPPTMQYKLALWGLVVTSYRHYMRLINLAGHGISRDTKPFFSLHLNILLKELTKNVR